MILRQVAYDFHPCSVPIDLKDRWKFVWFTLQDP